MNKFKEWVLKRFAKSAGNVLKEGPVDKKHWYLSRNLWTGVTVSLIGIYEMIQVNIAPQLGWTMPGIPPSVLSILGAIGIYTRVKADKPLGL